MDYMYKNCTKNRIDILLALKHLTYHKNILMFNLKSWKLRAGKKYQFFRGFCHFQSGSKNIWKEEWFEEVKKFLTILK